MKTWGWQIPDNDFTSSVLYLYYKSLGGVRGRMRTEIVSALELCDFPRALLWRGADHKLLREALVKSIHGIDRLRQEYLFQLQLIDSNAASLLMGMPNKTSHSPAPIFLLPPDEDIPALIPAKVDPFVEEYVPTLRPAFSEDDGDDDFDLPPEQDPGWGKTE
jgi:hypothetical protein